MRDLDAEILSEGDEFYEDDSSEISDDEHYEDLLELDSNVRRPVAAHVVNYLPVSKFTLGNKQNFPEAYQSCTICMCQFDINDEYMILPCLHRFHSTCIRPWFEQRNTCPNCKAKVESNN